MVLKIGKSNGREYLSIVQGYRDNITKKVRTKTIKSLGYLDELKKEFADPVAHFKKIVEDMNEEWKEKTSPISIQFDKMEILRENENNRKNLGHIALSKIYHELELDVFLRNQSRKWKNEFNLNSIVKLLVYSRILNPASKKKTFESKNMYFDKMDFYLDDVYRSLTQLNSLNESMQLHIHNKVKQNYARNTSLVYYDVTNYYFEIDEQDNLRRKGVSKEHRPDPIVQMGLFMDTNGMPISYGLFPGNQNDCKTLIPLLYEMKEKYNMDRTVIVADKGINTSKNISFNLVEGDGYIFSQTVRGGHKELKDYVLDKKDYIIKSEKFKIKSRIYPREITIPDLSGKLKKIRIEEKQIVFYSDDYAKRAKADRTETVHKAIKLVKNPAKYNRATSYGAAKYVKNLVFDKDTGEILTSKQKPVFDIDKLREEELFDGYYAIVTSECDKSDDEIINIYRGLWKIEESFKVIKGDLEARPVYLSREEHIRAHFLICFIALAIARILEHKLNGKYCISAIANSLEKSCCSHIKENWYLADYTDQIIQDIDKKMGIPLNLKYCSLGNIKKMLGNSKKG